MQLKLQMTCLEQIFYKKLQQANSQQNQEQIKNMQHQSAAQKIILNTNYRLHKERLTQIKIANQTKNANNTSLQFYSVNKSKNEDRKKLMMLQQRKQQIENQNQLLKTKINKIRGRDGKSISFYQDQQGRKQYKDIQNKNKRYNNQNQEEHESSNEPIAINQQDGDQNLKCAIPAPMHAKKRLSHFVAKSNAKKGINMSVNVSLASKQKDQYTINNKGNSIQKSASKNEHRTNNQARKSSHQLGTINRTSINVSNNAFINDREELLHPQLALDREIYYKKTTLLSNTTSCLLQISMVNKRLLLLAYVMGQQNFTAKLYLDQTRSKNLVNNCAGDYNVLSTKITVDKVNKTIKVTGMANPNIEKDGIFGLAMGSITEKHRKSVVSKEESYKIQQDFIKRNHFNREKNNKTADPTSQNHPSSANNQPTQTNRRSLVNTSNQNTANGRNIRIQNQEKHKSSFLRRFKFSHDDKQTQQNANLHDFPQAIHFKGQTKEKSKSKVDVSGLANRLSDPNYGRRDKKQANKIQNNSQNKFTAVSIESKKQADKNNIVNNKLVNKSKHSEVSQTNKSSVINNVRNTSKFSENSNTVNNNSFHKSLNNKSVKNNSKMINKQQQKKYEQEYQENQDDIIKNLDSEDDVQDNYAKDEFENQANKKNENDYQENFEQDFEGQGSPIIVTKKATQKNESNVYSQQFQSDFKERTVKNTSKIEKKNVKAQNYDDKFQQEYQDDFVQNENKNGSRMQKKSQVHQQQNYQQEFDNDREQVKEESINDQYDEQFEEEAPKKGRK